MKKQFLLTVLLISISWSFLNAQNNLLDLSVWTAGSDYLPEFPRYGSSSKNIRELDYGPHSSTEMVIIWKGLPDATSTSDGGWLTPYMPIDPSKKYRFTVWLKKINSNEGYTYFGFNALDASGNHASLKLDGSATDNPYFGSSNIVFPAFNEWYLFVAFVHPYTHTLATTEGGIYGTNGTKVGDVREFKFTSTATQVRHRAFLKDDNPLNELHFYAPSIYEVNGQEPTLAELLNPGGSPPDCSSSPLEAEYSINGSWSSGETGITLVEGDELRLSGLPNTLTVTITDPQGQVHGDNHSIYGVSTSDAGTYIVTDTSTGCTSSLVVTINASGGNPPPSSDSPWTKTGSTVAVGSNADNVAIGTSTVPSGYKLAVEGNVRAREIRVDQDNWPDYVFREDYELPTLEEIQKHIQEKGHLPNMPSAEEVEAKGVALGEMNRLLLEKIEELTLHIIQLKKEIKTNNQKP